MICGEGIIRCRKTFARFCKSFIACERSPLVIRRWTQRIDGRYVSTSVRQEEVAKQRRRLQPTPSLTAEHQLAYQIAHIDAVCGDADKAFGWLDKAVQYQDPGLAEILVDNLFDKIHSDPRWLPFLRQVGLAPSNSPRSSSR